MDDFEDILLQAVAVPRPYDPNAPAGDVEARFSVLENLLVTPAHIPGITLTSWAACVTVTKTGTGQGTVSGAFAGYAAGAPCDFAHSSPLIAGSSAQFVDNLTLDAQGNMVLAVRIAPRFFDSAGNQFNAFWGFTRVPEPPAFIPVALAFGGVVLALRRRRHPKIPSA